MHKGPPERFLVFYVCMFCSQCNYLPWMSATTEPLNVFAFDTRKSSGIIILRAAPALELRACPFPAQRLCFIRYCFWLLREMWQTLNAPGFLVEVKGEEGIRVSSG